MDSGHGQWGHYIHDMDSGDMDRGETTYMTRTVGLSEHNIHDMDSEDTAGITWTVGT